MKFTAVHLTLFTLCVLRSGADPRLVEGGAPPVAAPPAVEAIQVESQASKGTFHAAAEIYSIGDPTPEEQLYLEFINRARANPGAEGLLLANTTDSAIVEDYREVDLTLMQNQFSAILSAQPLAMSPKLTIAARQHSQDMLANVFQGHDGTDGSTTSNRVSEVGYAGSVGENVFANAKSVFHGHAAFEVDWGITNTVGGMQNPPGHRNSIHNPQYREVGIGVILGTNAAPGKQPLDHVGPQLVTQDFGVAQNSTPFITGVAYYDVNKNNFYDAGEGIGNVKVTVVGANYEASTARSGGYAIPVQGNGTYTVTFSGPGFNDFSQTVTVSGSKNVKLDFIPTYTPPAIAGPTVAAVNRATEYSVSTVPGAVAYEWRVFQKGPARSEGAEGNPLRVSIDQSGTYDVLEGIFVKSGSLAFHLATPTSDARSQYITLLPAYLLKETSSISFQSSLGFATTDQHARLQVSVDGGVNWQTIYNQDGDPDHPENDFSKPGWHFRSVDLGAFAGKAARFRFGFEFVRGQFFDSTDLLVGWLIDDIQFSNTEEITNERTAAVTGNSFQFSPDSEADFSLQARAKTGHNFLEWGPAISVRSVPATGVPQLNLAVIADAGGQLQFDIKLAGGTAPAKLTLESRDDLASAWRSEAANVQSLSGTLFRTSVPRPANSASRFYRIRAD